MRVLPVSPFRPEAAVRWTARALTAVFIALLVVPFVVNSIYDVVHGFYEGGLPHSFQVKGVGPAQLVLLCMACTGMVVGWRWPVIGGALSLAGMLLFFAAAFAAQGGLPGGLLPYLMLLPGILFLADGFIGQRMSVG
jgi:hypothetical protein